MACYEELEFVDRGRFATVVRGRNVKTNEIVALKKLWMKSALNSYRSMSRESRSNATTKASSPRIYKNETSHCVEQEIRILKSIQHTNIIKLLDTYHSDEYMVIVLQLMTIDLHHLLSNIERDFTDRECKYIIKQMFDGLYALHTNLIMHRDLKPANILFDANGLLKIADFGQARILSAENKQNIKQSKQHTSTTKTKQPSPFNVSLNAKSELEPAFDGMIVGCQMSLCSKHQTETYTRASSSSPTPQIDTYDNDDSNDALTNEVGTRWYKPPELLYGARKYDYSIDIWSAGCIIAEVLHRKPLFSGETDIDQLCKIFQILGTIDVDTYGHADTLPDFNKIVFNKVEPKEFTLMWPNVNLPAIQLIEACLQLNPKSRISAADAVKHEWLNLDQICDNEHHLNQLISTATAQLAQTKQKKMQLEEDFSFDTDHEEHVDDNNNDVIFITETDI